MIFIKQKRVRNLQHYIPPSLIGSSLIVGVPVADISREQLARLDMSYPPILGETILPPAIGPVTRFNSKGKENPLRDEPKETHYRDFEFTRLEWHGPDQVEVTGFTWVPYEKYPREFIAPPGLELTTAKSAADEVVMIFGPFHYQDEAATLLHAINLCLELFGQCFVYDKSGSPIARPKVISLNWRILPEGDMPWDVMSKALKERLESQRPKSKAAAMHRFQMISELEPDFCAVGSGGFRGYVVFGFSARGLYVMESQQANNAIYIFDDDWKILSKLTKAEILQSSSHVARIIHSSEWFHKLRNVLSN